MAKHPDTVQQFQEQLANKLLDKGKEELNELVKLKRDELEN